MALDYLFTKILLTFFFKYRYVGVGSGVEYWPAGAGEQEECGGQAGQVVPATTCLLCLTTFQTFADWDTRFDCAETGID